MRTQGGGQGVIFVLGMMPRTGTNLLSDLIVLHPDCARPAAVHEDFLLHGAGPLLGFAEALDRRWHRMWKVEAGAPLRAALGAAAVEALWQGVETPRLVTKTPSVHNLEHFPALFPEAHLLLVVRDGPATVESTVRSFGLPYEVAIHTWAEAAQRIADFDARHATPGARHRIVRFEDLHRDAPGVVCGLLSFLGLDPARYDFAAAAGLPVRGSADFGRGEGAVHWRAVEKSADFDPLGRARDWPDARRARFAHVAGDAAARLGYAAEGPARTSPHWRNAFLDIAWQARGLARALKRAGPWRTRPR